MLRKSLTILLTLPLMIIGMSSASATAPLVVTFEANDSSGYVHIDFDDNVDQPGHQKTTVVDGVEAGVGGKVLKVVRGTASWAGTTIIKDGSKTLIKTGQLFVKAKIYSPAAGKKLMMKIDNKDTTTQSVETFATESTVIGWHEYTFDFSVQRVGTEAFSAAKPATMASIFFDFTTTPTASTAGQTYYLDDVTFASATAGTGGGGGVVVPPVVPIASTLVTFEANDSSGYVHIDFDDNVDQPGHQKTTVVDGVEAGVGGKVLKVVRGTASWAGTTIIKDGSKTLIKTGQLFVKAKIYSPAAGKKLMMKIDNKDTTTQSVETFATESTVIGWHEYTFDFSVQRVGTEAFSAAKPATMASIFFDFTTTPTASTAGQTYYLDDVTFASATAGTGGGGVPVVVAATPTLLTYEAGDTIGAQGAAEANPDHPVGIFGGGSAAVVTSPNGVGGAESHVLALTKAGQSWTGYNAIVDTLGTLRITNGDFPNVTFNYISPKANSPVAVQLFIGDTMDVQMIQNANIGANNMKFDFSTAANWSASKIYTKLVIFPDFLVPTSTPADVYYFDNIGINGALTPGDVTTPPAAQTVLNVRLADWNATNSFDGTHIWGDGGLGNWFDANTGYFAHYVPAGSTFNLKYSVKTDAGVNAPNGTVVTLALGAAWSGSNAKFTVNGVAVPGVAAWGANGELDQATTTATVSGGYITVSVTSLDATADATGDPGSPTANPQPLNPLFMQIKTHVEGNYITHQDWVNIVATAVTAVADPPTITSISGTSGKNGQAIDIVGTNLGSSDVSLFTAATSKLAAVTTAVSVIAVSADGTRMTIRSPNKTQKGNLRVTTGGGTATSATLFSSSTSNTSKPAIVLAASVVKEVGSTLTLTGANLGSATVVKVGTVSASFTVVNANSIAVTIPADAVSGSTISATNAGGTVTTSKLVFHAPVVSTATASGTVGSTVTVTGTNLKATAISFGGNKTAKAVINNGNSLTFVVPMGATTGAIKITTGGGVVYTNSFTVLPYAPTVASFTPATGKKGVAIVTVKGKYLTGATVTVGSVAVTLSAGASDTSFKFVIPAGASTGKINVTTAGGSVSSATNLTVTN